MLQDGFRDDGIKGSIPEWQEVPIRDNIDFRCPIDVKVDDVWGAAVVAGTEIQDARLGSRVAGAVFGHIGSIGGRDTDIR